jgi:hypothetical protein
MGYRWHAFQSRYFWNLSSDPTLCTFYGELDGGFSVEMPLIVLAVILQSGENFCLNHRETSPIETVDFVPEDLRVWIVNG